MPQPPTVLVVDDDEDIRHATTDFLTGAGYACLEAADGRDALAQLTRLTRYAVVILDLMMPVMDGLEFLEEVARTGQLDSLRVVILSASPTLCEGRAVAAGLPIMLKPANPTQLLTLVEARSKSNVA